MVESNMYMGSRMSLISKENIRYEGLCQDIDMPNSTIVLGNVRCFGSEGRRGVNEVPGSDQIFERVVFKGTEIQELTVMQPAAEPAPPVADPAILSASQPPAASPWGAPPPPAAQQGFGASPWSTGPPPGVGAPPPAPPAPSHTKPAPAPTMSVAAQPQANGAPVQRERPSSYAHAAGGAQHTHHAQQHRGGRGGGRGAPGGRGGRGPPHQHAHPHAHAPRVVQMVPPVAVPTEEFNFEEALKKFNKEDIVKEAEAEVASYAKDDFFDSLSCEALEKMKLTEEGGGIDRRGRMAAQRRTDYETFGGSARGRGRGFRGRGGRGTGRGGGRGDRPNNGGGRGAPRT